jgi:hypothetical protein
MLSLRALNMLSWLEQVEVGCEQELTLVCVDTSPGLTNTKTYSWVNLNFSN